MCLRIMDKIILEIAGKQLEIPVDSNIAINVEPEDGEYIVSLAACLTKEVFEDLKGKIIILDLGDN